MLVATLLAAGAFAFSVVAQASPHLAGIDRQVVQPCVDDIQTQGGSAADSLPQLNDCVRPFVLAQLPWMAGGLAGELVVAVALYLLHPWWLIRRRRMAPLPADGNADVLGELDALAEADGITPPPAWMVAPYAAAHGGQAFGLPWRRRVCLDVGLLVRYDLDRDGFRAVVRHELAHLANRDVGRTYLTIALWWSFVAVAVVPLLSLSLGSELFPQAPHRGPREIVHLLAALLAMTVIGYLVRNAILRSRELCADATAGGGDAGPTLRRLVAALPWPPRVRRRRVPERLARLGAHPPPADRVGAMSDPDRLHRGSWPELIGLGLVTGLAVHNIGQPVGSLAGSALSAALYLPGLAAAIVLTLALAGAVTHAGDRRTVVLLPAGAAAGFAASGVLSLVAAADDGLGPLTDGIGPFLISALALAALLVLVACWQHSAHRQLRSSGSGRPVTAAAVLIAAPLIAVWFAATYTGNAFGLFDLSGVPQSGLTIGWYSEMARWVLGLLTYIPAARLAYTPLLPIGLTLLWAVPIVLSSRRRAAPRVGIRPAVVAGLVAGAAALVAAVMLPLAARATLPAEVRRTVDDGSLLTFRLVYGGVYMAVAALAMAAAAAVVAARSDRLRPVLVPLTVTVTGVVATAGNNLSWVAFRCLRLDDSVAAACHPGLLWSEVDPAFALHLILVWGSVAAIPAALAGAAAGTFRRGRGAARRRRFAHRAVRRPRRAAAAAGLGLLAVIVLSGAATALPGDYRIWLPDRPTDRSGAGPTPAGPSADPARTDPCLLGTWRETSARSRFVFDGAPTEFTGQGTLQTFRPDGVVVFDHGAGVVRAARRDGHSYRIIEIGRTVAGFRADGRTLRYSDARADPSISATVTVDGTVRQSGPTVANTADDRYTCAGNHLHESPVDPALDYDVDLVRVGPS